ncbi:MAG: DedA family protein [Deltaproteobacteria bacterium]|nr:DedA family protein [Deltaproteobacteria bacterium]
MDYAVVFLLALLEGLAIVGLLVPGSTAVAAAGAAAQAGYLEIRSVIALCVLGAFLGDSVSYFLGRRLHDWPRLAAWRQKHHQGIERTEHAIARWGGLAIVAGRFFGPTRAFVPLIAGNAQMPIALFVVSDIIGVVIWASVTAMVGEEGFKFFERLPSEWSLAIVAVGLVAWAAWAWFRRRKRRRRE